LGIYNLFDLREAVALLALHYYLAYANKNTMTELLTSRLKQFECIDFALLFGSYAMGTPNELSDIDIAISIQREYSLLELGRVIADMEQATGKRVDVIPVNELHKKNPALAYEIVSTGKMLFCNDAERFITFKRNSFIHYLDVQPMLDLFRKRFTERLMSGRFAQSNYAG
jgi:predicted nucleotidyltransferase